MRSYEAIQVLQALIVLELVSEFKDVILTARVILHCWVDLNLLYATIERLIWLALIVDAVLNVNIRVDLSEFHLGLGMKNAPHGGHNILLAILRLGGLGFDKSRF